MVIHHERAEAVPLRRGEGDEDVHGDRGAVAVLELELDEARVASQSGGDGWRRQPRSAAACPSRPAPPNVDCSSMD